MPVPFLGKTFTFTQPDGTILPVKGWGDQHYARFETLDGFTVVKDPLTGFFQYAQPTSAGELRPSGIRPGAVDPRHLAIPPNLATSRATSRALSLRGNGLPRGQSRWEIRNQRRRIAMHAASLAPGVLPAPPPQQTVGNFTGLCLPVQFADVPATISVTEIDNFCNMTGYSGFGNNGSVTQYYFDVSGGKLRYKIAVAPIYTTKHPRSYYTDPTISQPTRACELIQEALDSLKVSAFNFDQLSADSENYIYATNIFYAGPVVNNWSEGLWPHSYHLVAPCQLTANRQAYDYQITNMGSELSLGTFCHENGHMLCSFPDLYEYADNGRGIGCYCLMCQGANVNEKNPTQICAYLKYRAGWANSVTFITAGLTASIKAGSNQFYLFQKTPAEYFIVENRNQSSRDSALSDAGLAIWHVDEAGSNTGNDGLSETSPFECALIQADGRHDLELGVNEGDTSDLFRKGLNDHIDDASTPNGHWWDGTPSGLAVHNIGPAGLDMSFSA